MLPLGASPPGSASVQGILKKSGLTDPIMQNMTVNETCVIKMLCGLIEGKGDVSIIEKRLTTHARFKDKIEYMPIEPKFIPPAPLTFTINIMKYVQDKKLADDYADFVRSEEGQSILEKGGFTSVHSARGLDLIERFGVKDVQ